MTSAIAPANSLLRPYEGSHLRLPETCPTTMSTFSGDLSGEVAYTFNSLGFRGEEFDAAAARHIFACGCSITFGLGLDYEQAWVSVLRRRYAAAHGLRDADVHLQNFATSGCSNGYIVRTLIGQCARFQPSLALALLTFGDRAEMLEGDRSYNIGRWCVQDSFFDHARAEGHLADLRRTIHRKAKAHYDLYTPLMGAQDALKNALLLQLFCEARRIPFLIGIVRSGRGELPDHELLRAWRDCLDPERVFGISLGEILVDQSVSPGHPGPIGSQAIADAFFTRYQSGVSEVPTTPTTREPLPCRARQASSCEGCAVSEPPAMEDAMEDANVYPLF
jgi:hypothetical protein